SHPPGCLHSAPVRSSPAAARPALAMARARRPASRALRLARCVAMLTNSCSPARAPRRTPGNQVGATMHAHRGNQVSVLPDSTSKCVISMTEALSQFDDQGGHPRLLKCPRACPDRTDLQDSVRTMKSPTPFDPMTRRDFVRATSALSAAAVAGGLPDTAQ